MDTNIKQPTNLLTKEQVAKLYQCSVGTVNNMMKLGMIKYHKLGNLVRFRADELPILNKTA